MEIILVPQTCSHNLWKIRDPIQFNPMVICIFVCQALCSDAKKIWAKVPPLINFLTGGEKMWRKSEYKI